MSPLVNFEYNPDERLDRLVPEVAHDAVQRERAVLAKSVRQAVARIDSFRRGGLPLVDAVRRVGLPKDAWKLLGATRELIRYAAWQRRGTDKAGNSYWISSGHLTQDGRTTFCGRVIPSTTTHTVRITLAGGFKPCRLCHDLCSPSEAREVQS